MPVSTPILGSRITRTHTAPAGLSADLRNPKTLGAVRWEESDDDCRFGNDGPPRTTERMIVATGQRNSGRELKKPKAEVRKHSVSRPLPGARPSKNKPRSVA